VLRSRHLDSAIRALIAAALALCFAVRLVTPAGFMPSVANGALAIVPCPDAFVSASEPMPAMAMDHGAGEHRHHGTDGAGQSCPYAAAVGMAGIDTGPVAVFDAPDAAILPPVAAALPLYRRLATRDRPPSRGPPLPA
jgi:hypothetical protein